MALLLTASLGGCEKSATEGAETPSTGLLRVQSRPGGAEVWLGGRRLAETPVEAGAWLSREVEEGWLELFVVAPDGRFASKEIFVPAGATHSEALDLEPLTDRARGELERRMLAACARPDLEACRRLLSWSDRLSLSRDQWATVDGAARRLCDAGNLDGCLLSATMLRRDLPERAPLERVARAFDAVCRAGEPRGCVFTEGFEGLDWKSRFRSAGTGDWRRQADCGVGAGTCLWSGETAHDETSTVRLRLELAAPGEISFRYRAERQACCDHLDFLIDGARVARLERVGSVATYRHPVAPGRRTFAWRFQKDGAVSEGADAVWIDDVIATGVRPPAPRF